MRPPIMPTLPDRPTRIRVAARASVDPRTVDRYLRGSSVREVVRLSIERALRACGLATLIRREAA